MTCTGIALGLSCRSILWRTPNLLCGRGERALSAHVMSTATLPTSVVEILADVVLIQTNKAPS